MSPSMLGGMQPKHFSIHTNNQLDPSVLARRKQAQAYQASLPDGLSVPGMSNFATPEP